MTKKDLEQYRSIVAEIDEVRESIRNGIVSDTVVGSDAHFPYTAHTVSIGGDDDIEWSQRQRARLARLVRQRNQIEDFVNVIPDSLTRRIFRYRYIDGSTMPTWTWIAFKIGRGSLTGDAVRKEASRYLKKYKND